MAKKMTKKEISNACKFSGHSVLKTVDDKAVNKLIDSLSNREEQDKFFEEKTITIKPLSEMEIAFLTLRLTKEGFEASQLADKTDSELLQIIRDNKDKIETYINEKELGNRLFIDEATSITETRWSSANAWKQIKEHPEYLDFID